MTILSLGCYSSRSERSVRNLTASQCTIDKLQPLPVRLEGRCMYDTTRSVQKDAEWFDLSGDKIYSRLPIPIHKVYPKYSFDTTKSDIYGTVFVKAYVDSTGRVIRACIIKNNGVTEFEIPALRAAMQWIFEPALSISSGHPLGALVSIPFRKDNN
ncbi:MAG: TonB family protein [Ignavibacteriales bacterium]|nr:TonB family protein [Ignavibacteriales bacterium]